MFFRPVEEGLSEEKLNAGLRAVLKDGLTTQAMTTLTAGVFLVAFALKLGATNEFIGWLAAIPPLTQLVQIPAIYVVEKLRNRKTITVWSALLSRMFLIPIIFIPFYAGDARGLSILVSALVCHTALAAIGGCSWNSWMHDLIPHDRLGAFFSRRMLYATGLSLVLSLVAGIYIDYWSDTKPAYELYGYAILFFFGCAAGFVGVYFLTRIPEPRMAHPQGKVSYLSLLIGPLKDANFKNLIMFLCSWNFAVNLAAPFFTVYMLNRLKFSMAVIVALTIVSQAANMLFLRVWGKFADRFSNKSVLKVSGPLFIFGILAWTFTTMPERYFLTMPLLIVIHIVMGISTAGITLASGNIGLKLAPKGLATSYLAAMNFFNSLAAASAPILGGIFADFFARRELSWTLTWTSPAGRIVLPTLDFRQWDFFFFLAFLIGIYSIRRLARVKEVGEVKEKIVVQEFIAEVRRGMRNLSTAGGLRQMVQLPVFLRPTGIRLRYRKKKEKDVPPPESDNRADSRP
jgi:MFS family permease